MTINGKYKITGQDDAGFFVFHGKENNFFN